MEIYGLRKRPENNENKVINGEKREGEPRKDIGLRDISLALKGYINVVHGARAELRDPSGNGSERSCSCVV